MQTFHSPLRFRSLMSATGIVLTFGFLVTAGGAVADDLRPAKAWLDEIPAPPRTLVEVGGTCSAIRAKGKAIKAAYEKESDSLDAQVDDLEEMDDQQAMAMLMQGGGMQEMQQFAQAQMQMADGLLNEELPALNRRKQHVETRIDELREQLLVDLQCKDAGMTVCERDGEGMTAADVACHERNEQIRKQCRRDAAGNFLQVVQGPLQDWKGELRRYLDAREGDLLEQEAAYRNKNLRGQWKRQRIDLLEQAADYASFAAGVCYSVERLRLENES